MFHPKSSFWCQKKNCALGNVSAVTQHPVMPVPDLGRPEFKAPGQRAVVHILGSKPSGMGNLRPLKLPAPLSSEPGCLMGPWDARGSPLLEARPAVAWLPELSPGQLRLTDCPQHHSEMPQEQLELSQGLSFPPRIWYQIFFPLHR